MDGRTDEQANERAEKGNGAGKINTSMKLNRVVSNVVLRALHSSTFK